MKLANAVTPQEAAQLLGYAECTVYRHIAKGIIKKLQVAQGHRVLIPVSEITRIKLGIPSDYPPPKRKRNSDGSVITADRT